MFKAKVETSGYPGDHAAGELEDIDNKVPLLKDGPDPNTYVSVRFYCETLQKGCCNGAFNSCGYCACCRDTILVHRHQIVVPENTTVGELCQIATRMVNAEETYNICKLNSVYRLLKDDPLGPTLRAYEWVESPILELTLAKPEECCCLMV